jgi:serine/threonine-protein kinase RsbW
MIGIRGDLDFRTAPEVKEALLHAVVFQRGPLVVDLSGVGFVDSSGLSALFEAAKLAQRRESRIRLTGVHHNVLRLLTVCGFIGFFDIEAGPEPDIWEDAPWDQDRAAERAGQMVLPGAPASVPLIRRRVEEVARAMGFRDGALRDLLIAVSEAATNAMKHGSPLGEQNRILVRYQPDGDRLVVEVTDEGPGFDPLAVPVPVAEQMREGGMGVFFIRTLMDEVSFGHNGSGSTVRMVKYL